MASIISSNNNNNNKTIATTHNLVPIATLSGHTDRVWSIDFSPDGTFTCIVWW